MWRDGWRARYNFTLEDNYHDYQEQAVSSSEGGSPSEPDNGLAVGFISHSRAQRPALEAS